MIVRTTKDAAKLGLANGEASEKGEIGEVEDVAPGKTKSRTVTLKRGITCSSANVAGHYEAGMRINCTVR